MKKYIYNVMALATFVLLAFTACDKFERTEVTSEIFVNHRSINLFEGETFQLTASPVDGGTFQWSVIDSEIATVENGLVKGVKSGSTIVLATRGSSRFAVNVTVTPKIPLTDIEMSATTIEVLPGNTFLLQANTVPASANDVSPTDYRWWSDNESIARITDEGKVYGLTEGITTIHYRRGSITKAVSVIVSRTFAFKGPHIISKETPLVLPFRDFDFGGEGYAFHDVDESKTGDSYRANNGDSNSAAVDIEGGNNIGYTASGEWLLYTITVNDDGIYDLTFTGASADGGGECFFEIDGINESGNMDINRTGGWGRYTTLPTDGPAEIELKKGIHKLKFVVAKAGFNMRDMKFSYNRPL